MQRRVSADTGPGLHVSSRVDNCLAELKVSVPDGPVQSRHPVALGGIHVGTLTQQLSNCFEVTPLGRVGHGCVRATSRSAKQKRQLKKEGLDDAPQQVRKQPKRKAPLNPKSLLGRRVKIKWDGKGEMTVAAQRDRGKVYDKFYPGKLEKYDRKSNRFMIRYDDAKRRLFRVNLIDPKQDDFIPSGNWAFL